VRENLITDDHDTVDNATQDEEDDNSVEDHVVIRLRNGLLSILELCFAQYIPNSYDHGDGESTAVQHSEEQHSFSDFVQLAAGRTTSDLRTLFPKEYANAASPLLRSFALQDDGRLIGAYVRFLESKEYLLREYDTVASVAERKLSQSLLYPMGRAIATNWTNGNRREAGVFLRHISGSGPTAADIVSATSRQMKKIHPVRMLESQMASLRQSYESWADATPELETDFPSEEEMAMFEDEEKTHKESFAKLEHRASQFSQTLGVFGKLGSASLGPALRGFIREGIRFSFSNLDENNEDTLVLGSRLSFLLLLSKYANWAKKDKKHKAEISEYVDSLESEMRNHQEFEEVHADDLESLAAFRNIMGLKASSFKSTASVASVRSGRSDGGESEESLDNVSDLPSPVPSTGSRSIGSRASRSSRLSSTLPTLPEAEKEESPQDGDSDSDSRFSSSPDDSLAKKRSQSQMTYEHSDDDEMVASSVPLKTKTRMSKRRKN
jgi:cohesin complex subunit SA-1/2